MGDYVHELGLSARAIAGRGVDHPHDPADLLRCVRYCESRGIDVAELRDRMAGRSVFWDALLDIWPDLAALVKSELDNPDGRAPLTYQRMQHTLTTVPTRLRDTA